MKSKTTFLFILILISHLTSCAILKEFVKEPSVSLEDISYQPNSLFEGTALFYINVTNPNPIGTKINHVIYHLEINDEELVKNEDKSIIDLGANSTHKLELPVTFNYLDIFKTVQDLFGAEEFKYKLYGTIGVGPLAIPFERQGMLPIPKPPSVSIKKCQIANFGFTGATIIMHVDVESKESFPVGIEQLDYNINMGNINLAQGMARNVSVAKDAKKTTLELPVKLNFLKLGRSVYDLLKQQSTTYSMKGQMHFNIPKMGKKAYNFDKEGSVNFEK